MPELVSGGPIIPVQLMNKLDSGRIVFFCGAGVSVGTGSGLPTFADLVQTRVRRDRDETGRCREKGVAPR